MPKLQHETHQEKGEMNMTQLQTTNLDQKTQIIKHKIKTIENNFFDIGMELKVIRDNKIYKEKYSSFEKYITENFEFNVRTAHRMIQIVEQPNIHDHLLSFSKWVELLSAPVEMREELAKDAENLSEKELREKIQNTDNAYHVVDDMICKQCNRKLNNSQNLIKHEKVCMGNNCEKCGYTPKNPRTKNSDLKRHLKTCKGIKKVDEEKQTTIVEEKEPEVVESPTPFMEKEFDVFTKNWQEMSNKTIPRLQNYISGTRFNQINKQRRREAANHINSVIKQLREIVHKLLP